MKKVIIASAGLVMMGMSTVASAEFGIGVKASTLGAGVELGMPLSDRFVARLGLNSYSRSANQSIDNIDYDADLDLSSTALFVDWSPFKQGSFHLTAGYVASNSSLSATARPTGSVDVGNNTYTVSDLTLKANVDLGSGPYLGLGWGNVPAKGFGFTFDLGVVQQGKPDVSLKKSGTDSGLISDADLKQEEKNMQNDLDNFDLYPVVSIGLSYGF